MTAPSVTLLPCPFCGGSSPLFHAAPSTYVVCTSCGVEGPWNDDGDCNLAATQWNTRATPTPSELRERVARVMVRTDPNYCIYHMPGDGPREWKATSGYRGKTSELSAAEAERVRARADAILALLPAAAAIYICYDGHGDYFVRRERPASHVAIVYDEDTAEKVVDLFNNDIPDAAAIRAAAFEEAAKIAENFNHRDKWSDDIDMNAAAYTAAGETCDAIAAAIRAAGEDAK